MKVRILSGAGQEFLEVDEVERKQRNLTSSRNLLSISIYQGPNEPALAGLWVFKDE